MKSIIDTYNSNSHRTLGNKTPNQVFKGNDDQIARQTTVMSKRPDITYSILLSYAFVNGIIKFSYDFLVFGC